MSLALYSGLVTRFAGPDRDDELDALLIRAAPAREDRRTLFVASTADEDRAGDIVAQDWRTSEFRANPVVLDNHSPYRVVGRGVEAGIKRDTGNLEVLVEWDLENPDPSIRAVGHQHLNGFRAGASVGFRSMRKVQRHELPKDHPAYREQQSVDVGWGSIKLGSGMYFEKNVLLELSSATIPMNGRALQRPARGSAPAAAPADPKALSDLADVVSRIEDPIERAAAIARHTLHSSLAAELVTVLRADPAVRRAVLGLVDAGPIAPAPTTAPTLRGDGLDFLFTAASQET